MAILPRGVGGWGGDKRAEEVPPTLFFFFFSATQRRRHPTNFLSSPADIAPNGGKRKEEDSSIEFSFFMTFCRGKQRLCQKWNLLLAPPFPPPLLLEAQYLPTIIAVRKLSTVCHNAAGKVVFLTSWSREHLQVLQG